MTSKRKNLIINFSLGLIVVVFCYMNPGVPDASILHRLVDGCFIAGTMLVGTGVILFCSSKGAFNILGFGVMYGINLILPVGKNPWMANGERETYYDYCQRQSEKKPKPYGTFLITGAAFMLVSLVLLIPLRSEGKTASIEDYADSSAVLLTQEQLDSCMQWFNDQENNGLLRAEYTDAAGQFEKLAFSLELMLYGVGDAGITADEISLMGEEETGEGKLRLSRQRIIGYLSEKFGMDPENAAQLLENPELLPAGIYLEKYDSWYLTYDESLHVDVAFLRGEIREDGTVRLFYMNPAIAVIGEEGSLTFEHNVLAALTLCNGDNGWYVVSNEILK